MITDASAKIGKLTSDIFDIVGIENADSEGYIGLYNFLKEEISAMTNEAYRLGYEAGEKSPPRGEGG